MIEVLLRSGLTVQRPADRLLRFCLEEYEYYDNVPGGDPNRIEPVDVLATVGLNSRIDTAAKLRTVHRGMAHECNSLLSQLPEGADLAVFDQLERVLDLLTAAMATKFVLLSAATKVLHRKRPNLIPVLDGVVVAHYLLLRGEHALLYRSWSSRSAATAAARLALADIRGDLLEAADALSALGESLAGEGYRLTSLRILDILIWTETEPSGLYR
jgi:hypothetical protein